MRGPRSISCIVCERWLRFRDVGQSPFGAAVFIDVMTDAGGEPRKICELAVTLEGLQDVIEVCQGDAMRREEIKRREEIERGRLH